MIPRERRGLAHFSADLIVALRRRARPKNVPVPLRKSVAGDWLIFRPT